MLRERDREVGASVEAVVMGSSKERVTLMVGARAAVLPIAGMKWAGDWTPGRFKVGDVVLVKIEQRGSDNILEVSLDQHPEIEGSFLAMETETGLVRAMVGGYDFQRSQVNRATRSEERRGGKE